MDINKLARNHGADCFDLGKREAYLDQYRLSFNVDQLTAFAEAYHQQKLGEMALVPIDILESWYKYMASDWYRIDGEWGPSDGGIEAAISSGEYPELASIADYIRNAHEAKK
jgi:hypothetical protein